MQEVRTHTETDPDTGYREEVEETYDPATGEIIRTVRRVDFVPKRKVRHSDRYTLLFTPGWAKLRDTRSITLSDVRLFAALQARSRYDDEFAATAAELAKEMGWDRPRVYRALSNLVETGFIRRVRPGTYAHNPEVSWSGTAERRELEKQRQNEETE